MIRKAVSCPYCHAVIAIDDRTGKIVFNPDRADPAPCAHLAYFEICLDPGYAWADWTFEYGKGLHVGCDVTDEDHMLFTYLLFYEDISTYLTMKAPHVWVGKHAMDREKERPGSGEFILSRRGQKWSAQFNGYAIFSPQPAEVVKEFKEIWKDIPRYF